MSAQNDEAGVRPIDRNLLFRLLSFARPHRGGFFISTLLLMGIALCSLMVPQIVEHAVDHGMQGDGDDAERSRELQRCAAAMVGIAFLVFFLRRTQIFFTNRTGQRVIHDLRRKVFDHITSRSLAFFHRQPVGTLVTRVTGDIEALNEFFVSGIDVLFYDLLRIVVILVILFATDWQMALATVAIMPFIVLWAFIFQRRSRRFFREVRGMVSEANAYTNEALSGVRVVQAFAREEAVGRRFAGKNDDLMKAHLRTVRNFSWFFPGMEVLSAAGQAMVLVAGFYLVKGERIEIGTVVATWLYLTMFIEPLRQLADKYNIFQAAVAAGERVFAILDDDTAIRSPDKPHAFAAPQGAIRFEGVHFHYDPRKPVLEGIDLEVGAGKTVALVGPTGSGKSTIISLLSRFYDPTEGRVSLDGVDLRELDVAWLRSRVGVVLQDVFLFEGTVRENLTLGRDDLEDERLHAAIEAVQASGVVTRLGGLDGEIMERGAGLSTGEKQLLAFARTLAHDPLVLVLDEATAHIDTETEALLQKALEKVSEGRTSVVIAHRLSTVTTADEILVLCSGRIHERGTHAALLKADGLYARLYRLQFEDAS